MRPKAWAGAILMATAILSACGDEAITGVPYEPLFGTWTAVSFDNEPLPIVNTYTAPGTGIVCTVTTSSLQLSFDAAGRYSYIDSSQHRCGEEPPFDGSNAHSGTYRVVGDVLYLRATGHREQSTDFTLDANVLVIQLYDLNDENPAPLELHRTSGG